MNREKLSLLGNAYKQQKVDEARDPRGYITVINDEQKKTAEVVKQIQFDICDDVGFELAYEVMSDACSALADADEYALDDPFSLSQDTASIYTRDRLDYITINNQDEISEIAREYATDIQSAAAIWYDNQVATAISALLEWVNEEDDEEDQSNEA